MRRALIATHASLLLAGCSWFSRGGPSGKGTAGDHAATETSLVSFSMTIRAHYLKLGQPLPADLDEARLLAILEQEHPRQDEVKKVKSSYRLRARAADGVYALVLCDRASDQKIMEDLGCTLSRVDFRYWDRQGAVPCEFEQDWSPRCQ